MKKLLFLFLCLIVWAASTSHAHQPLWNESSPDFDSSFVVEEIRVSKAIFGDLEAGEIDIYQLDMPPGYQLNISLFKGNCKAFDPKLWVVAETDSEAVDSSPFDGLELPDGYGVTRLEPAKWNKYNGHGLKGFKGTELSEFYNGTVYLIVEAGEESGPTLLSLAGLEDWGGTDEGRAAMPRFNNCQLN